MRPLPSFASRLIRWQEAHGRHGLPWQGTRDAYRIWLSEVMLQQTQVATVLPYYERFTARFPRVADLAAASPDEVLALWSGLGYYARARNLHRAARDVVERFGGAFPTRFEQLQGLPGVGRSTAAAIAAFASGERRAILDGNVRRVLARHAGIEGDPASAATLARLWEEAERRLPHRGIEAYTQAIMDLGADLCRARSTSCPACPVRQDCVARIQGRIAQLPTPRARRADKRRRVAMLVVLCAGEVLLEKRPPAGVWGGLWSLPEAPVDEPPEAAAARLGIEAREAEPLPAFEHRFTHFTLEVAPWKLRARTRSAAAREPATAWLPLAQVAGAALPSPVKRLLRSVAVAAGSCAAPPGAAPGR